jgi:hypothetical protein
VRERVSSGGFYIRDGAVGGELGQWRSAVTTSMASTAWPLQVRASLGSQHLGERVSRAPPWRGLEGWDAGLLVDQEGVVTTVGFQEK